MRNSSNCSAIAFGPSRPTTLELRGIRFADAGGDGGGAGGDGKGGGDDGSGEGGKPESFTQADVNRIVQRELAQQAKNKFGDYEDLKKQAAGAQTLEEQLATLRTDLEASNVAGMRARIAAEFGISTKKGSNGEPSDADLFLTGTDEASLTAQAERLGERVTEPKKKPNVARKEGATQTTGKADDDRREFVRELFDRPD